MKIIPQIIVLSTLALAACSSGPYTSKAEQNPAVMVGSNVFLIDKDLRRTLTVDPAGVTSTRDSAGRLQIQANLRNRTNDETLNIQVQTMYLDKTGRVLYTNAGNALPWESFVLSPNQNIVYTQTALTPQASDFRIQIRYTTNRKVEE